MPDLSPLTLARRPERSAAEYAALLGVSKRTVQRWCKAGLPHRVGQTRGRPRIINVNELRWWLWRNPWTRLDGNVSDEARRRMAAFVGGSE